MSRLKSVFEKSRVIGPLHTGGPVAVSSDGQHIITCVGEEAVLTRLEDGQELCRFTSDSETIHSLCLTPSSSHLVLFTASLSMHIYDDPLSANHSNRSLNPKKTIARAHDAPVHVCRTDPSSTLLASGSADGIVKVWDIRRGYVTHTFKGHGGVVSSLLFRFIRDTSNATNIEPAIHLISASVDTRLRIFDLSASRARSGTSKPIAVLEGHVSVPRGIAISKDGRWLISGGRDSVALIWDLHGDSASLGNKRKGKEESVLVPALMRTIPILERVEAVGIVKDDAVQLHFFTAGEKGVVKVWDAHNGTMLFGLSEGTEGPIEMEEQREIVEAFYIPSSSSVMSIHADQNLLFHSLVDKSLIRQLVGFNDEIIGATFLSVTGADSHLAIAANSSLIRVYSTIVNDARLLSGHSSVVLCLDRSADGHVLASGGKDKTARLWSFSPNTQSWRCLGSCEGHAESVGAIALSRKTSDSTNPAETLRFMFTGSQDRTIKMWDLSTIDPTSDVEETKRCKSLATHKAHEKDINSLDVSPNDQFLASGSQDKTAKIYEITYVLGSSGAIKGDIKLRGTCKGHKRGVWTVKFGRTEKVLATGSGDKTVKLWNIDDFTCVKTFEGHTNSVLQIGFLNRDMQLASSASDGLLKLWNVRTEECVATMDNHEDKIWALAISSDEDTIVTGAADSVITFWKNCTEQREQDKLADREKIVLKEQDFQNYVSMKDYRNAISLALAMDQPGRLLALFKAIIDTNSAEIHEIIRTLPSTELATLLWHIRDWNATAKNSAVAQTILHAVFKLRTTADISDVFHPHNQLTLLDGVTSTSAGSAVSLAELVQSLIPYTERHLARLNRLVQDSYIVDYVLGEMDGGLFDDEPDTLMI